MPNGGAVLAPTCCTSSVQKSGAMRPSSTPRSSGLGNSAWQGAPEWPRKPAGSCRSSPTKSSAGPRTSAFSSSAGYAPCSYGRPATGRLWRCCAHSLRNIVEMLGNSASARIRHRYGIQLHMGAIRFRSVPRISPLNQGFLGVPPSGIEPEFKV